MKKIYIILVAVLLTASTSSAQTPQKISYQAVVRDENSALITSTKIGIEINIYQAVENTLIYTETQQPTTNINGLLNIEIGEEIGFDTINWANGSYFIETNVDPTGGTNYSITGISQLLSVPYALHAKTAESIVGNHYIGELYNGGIVFFVDETRQHGLIASLKDLDDGNGVAWSPNNLEIGTNGQNMTNGAGNTAAIIAQNNTAGYAASLCSNYTNDGFNDWYLPSNRELCLLCSQDILIDKILDNDGDPNTTGFLQEYISPTFGRYWSSTEYNSSRAWYYKFLYNDSDYNLKSYTYRVRAIRAF